MGDKLTELNNHLFAQLDRLTAKGVTGDKLSEEVQRAKAISGIAGQIIGNAKLALEAQLAVSEGKIKQFPAMLGLADETADK